MGLETRIRGDAELGPRWVQGHSSKPGTRDSTGTVPSVMWQARQASHSPHKAPGASHQKADSMLVA